MSVEDFWQENKRFVVSVGGGLLVFLIGSMIVDRLYGSEVARVRTQLRRNESSLSAERYRSADLERAREANEALAAAVETLSSAVSFETRPDFLLNPRAGGASSQYFARADLVRQELASLASKTRMRLPADLGLESLKTTREEVIVRHLEALDLIDRAVRMALDAGVERIDKIQVRLDPAFDSRAGLGAVERTRVTFQMSSTAEPVVRFLAATQSGRFGSPLVIEESNVTGARSKLDEVRAEVTFLVVRLARQDADADIEEI